VAIVLATDEFRAVAGLYPVKGDQPAMAVEYLEQTRVAPRIEVRAPAIATSKAGWVLALTSVASFMVALDTLVVTNALSTIRIDLGASIEALQWTANAYNLSFAALLLTGAALGDYLGRRRVMAIGLGLFTLASAAAALSPNIGFLIAARAVQGAGGAFVMPLAMALLSAAYAPEARAKALGLFGGFTGIALLLGPVIGGAIVQGLDWHWIFWLNVPIGVVTIGLVLSRIEESRGPRAGLDVLGVVLASSASLALVWGLARANSAGWNSPEIEGALAIGALLGVAFVGWELRVPAPMIPMRLFGSRAFSAGLVSATLFTAALYGTLFFIAQFLQTSQGYGPLGAGVRLLPWTATLFVVAPLAGRLVNRFGERPLIVLGLLAQAAGMAWIAQIATPEVDYLQLVLPMIIAGTGICLAMPAAQNAVLGAVAPHEIGKASGTYNMLRFLGGALGIAINASVFAAAGGFGSPQLFSSGFAAAVNVSALASFIAAGAGLFVPAMVARRASRR
jgi:EmrB/QacA subfamily drug resistance transporter